MEEKERILKDVEKKAGRKPFLEDIPGFIKVLFIGAIFIIATMYFSGGITKTMGFFLIGGLLVVLSFFIKKGKEENMISPKEARVLFENECEEMQLARNPMFPQNSEYFVTTITPPLYHNSAPKYYLANIELHVPNRPIKLLRGWLHAFDKRLITIGEYHIKTGMDDTIPQKDIPPRVFAWMKKYPEAARGK